MAKPLSFGHVKLGLNVGMTEAGATPEVDTPLCIAFLGDWSGRAGRGAAPVSRISDRVPLLIDRDNFDQIMAKAGVSISMPGASGAPPGLSFAALDDFHPDRILERVQEFQALRQLRARLNNPSSFASAAAEMKGWAAAMPAAGVVTPVPEPEPQPALPSNVDPANLLDQILGENPPATESRAPSSAAADWHSYIMNIVQPFLLPRVDYTKQAQLLALVDEVMGQQMRGVLHDPHFQVVEAAWRGLFFLAHRLETDVNLKLYFVDISKAELAADLSASDDLEASEIYRLLVKRTVPPPGGNPWGILVGDYTFDHSQQDVEMLGRMAQVAAQAGAPFLAAANPHVLGCRSLAETPDVDDWKDADPDAYQAWEALRRLPEARYLGLGLPRFLLRAPYGKKTHPIEQFDFEEMPEGGAHEQYLWGNPSFACAYLLAESFSRFGWSFRPGEIQDITSLPTHFYLSAGETQMKPCAEVWLTERSAEAIAEKGLIALQSVKNQDAVRVLPIQSLAAGSKLLAGRWCR